MQVCVTRKGRACVCEGDAGAAAGFRRVFGAFVATYTGQLAVWLNKIQFFCYGLVLMQSSLSSPAAACAVEHATNTNKRAELRLL